MHLKNVDKTMKTLKIITRMVYLFIVVTYLYIEITEYNKKNIIARMCSLEMLRRWHVSKLGE